MNWNPEEPKGRNMIALVEGVSRKSGLGPARTLVIAASSNLDPKYLSQLPTLEGQLEYWAQQASGAHGTPQYQAKNKILEISRKLEELYATKAFLDAFSQPWLKVARQEFDAELRKQGLRQKLQAVEFEERKRKRP